GLQDGDEIDDGDVRRGDAHGVAVQFALEFGHDQADSLGGAGGSGDHVDGGGAGATEILVGVVEHLLIVGIAVDGGHRALFHAELLVDDLHHGPEAIGGATGIRDDVVLGRIVRGIVDSQDKRDVFVLGRSRDNDLLDGTLDVLGSVLAIGEETGGFNDDFGADAGPIEFGGILGFGGLDVLARDRDRVRV